MFLHIKWNSIYFSTTLTWLGQTNEPWVQGMMKSKNKARSWKTKGEKIPSEQNNYFQINHCVVFLKWPLTREVVEEESQNDKLLIMPRDPSSLSWWCFLNMSGSFLRPANDRGLICFMLWISAFRDLMYRNPSCLVSSNKDRNRMQHIIVRNSTFN